MSKGKIKNFTLAGDALMLTAMVDKSGDTRYQLDTSLAFGETLTYEGLVNMLEAVKSDIDNVFELGITYKREPNGCLAETDYGELITDGVGLNNDFVENFERTWSND